MRKIVAGLFISLDGVYEEPGDWHFPYFNDEMGASVGAQMEAADTMLLGRQTYEEFAGFWPSQSNDEVDIADHMNNIPKVVVSTTLKEATWNNTTLISDNVVEELTKLKQQPGKNIGVTGSGTLVASLLSLGLLDELNLLVHPFVVGSGKRLFENGVDKAPLKLVSSKVFENGVLNLVYAPADAENS